MRRSPRVLLVAGTALAAAAAGLAPGASAASAQVRGYVVVLEDGVGPPAAVAERLSSRYGGEVGYVYRHALRGFYVRTTDRAAVALASNPNVDYVEAESPVTVDAQTTPTGVARAGAASNSNIAIDGVDKRVDVDVAVLDTGIAPHEDLVIHSSISCVDVSVQSECGGTGGDAHGHGTHVAGSIAALDNSVGVVGMAPGARLWSVKVLGDDGSGSNAGVAAGLDWVAARASTIEVANLSLGGGYSLVMNQAVARTVDAGVSVVVAAGNDGKDAKNYSPASEPTAITVSALADFNGKAGGGARWTCYPDTDDTLADFSNYGSVIDIIAPGMCIRSTVPGGYGTKSGTSMAAPHVAGAAALLRSAGASGTLTESLLKSEGNFGWTGDRDSVQEPLLDVSDSVVVDPKYVDEAVTEPPANTAPTAAFTSSCAELTCSFTDTSTDSDGTIASRSWNFGDGTTSTATGPSHTYSADGTYTVTLTVTDDDGATGSVTQSVSVVATTTDPPPSSSDPVFTPSSTSQGSKWTAIVTVSNGGDSQSYTGSWSNNGGADSCTTNAAGTCSIELGGIAKKVGSVTWTHTGGVVTVTKP